ncbi:hypothetical protein EGW08_003811, partial [Elysia chlorotica]
MDRVPSPRTPLDTGQAKSKPLASRHEKEGRQERREQLVNSVGGGRGDMDSNSSGREASEPLADAGGEDRRDRRRRESDGGQKDAAWAWGNGDRRSHAEDARERDRPRKRSGGGDSEGRRSTEPESKRRPGPELDSGVGARSGQEDVRLSFESDSSARSLDYSRRSLEAGGTSRRSMESPDSHNQRAMFSPPPPPHQTRSPSPSHRQPEPAHSRTQGGSKKKRAAPRATISSSQPEQDEPTDLALSSSRRDLSPAQRERSISGSGGGREAADFSRDSLSGGGRREATPKGSPPSAGDYTPSSTITTSSSAASDAHRRASSPPQGPSSSTSPASPSQDSSPYSNLPPRVQSERGGQQNHYPRQAAAYRDEPAWRGHPQHALPEQSAASSRTYSPAPAEEFRGSRLVSGASSSSSPSSPPGSSGRLGEESLLRHLKTGGRAPQDGPVPRRGSGDAGRRGGGGGGGGDIRERDGAVTDGRRRVSDESRSPGYSPLEPSST